MRGALDRITGGLGYGRIIPADAGSTSPITGIRSLSRDHPRGCGEHMLAIVIPSTVQGSSPRMRGAHYKHAIFGEDTRIIPADAGSTTPKMEIFDAKQDHPRGCGEH